MLKVKDFIPPIVTIAYRSIRGRHSRTIASRKYNVTLDDYDASVYWEQHHKKHGSESLVGVGHGGLTEEENVAWYRSAKYIFKGILLDAGISSQSKVLELGYGTGFYSQVCSELRIGNYFGVDIVDQHAEKLRSEFSGYGFDKADIGSDNVQWPGCDLVYMVDVSQHIVSDDKLKYCLRRNVEDNIKMGGLFIVTDELENEKYAFYEKSRSIEFYQAALENMILEQAPILFRDKYIFSFRKHLEDGASQ